MALTKIGTPFKQNPSMPAGDSYSHVDKHYHPSGLHGYLLVCLIIDSTSTIPAVSFGSTVMEQVSMTTPANSSTRQYIYGLKEPPVGSYNINLTLDGQSAGKALSTFAQSFSGCGGVNPNNIYSYGRAVSPGSVEWVYVYHSRNINLEYNKSMIFTIGSNSQGPASVKIDGTITLSGEFDIPTSHMTAPSTSIIGGEISSVIDTGGEKTIEWVTTHSSFPITNSAFEIMEWRAQTTSFPHQVYLIN
jgi:hypothetical protein